MKKIRSTTDYKRFTILKGNRSIKKDHVKKLMNSISQMNLMEYNPILVTEEGVVIDGQHRLKACKELGIPVFYMEIKGNLDTVQQLNENSRNWATRDYVDSFVSRKFEDYIELRDFKEKYGIPYGLAGSLLMDGKARTGGGASIIDTIKSGKFMVVEREQAENIMSWVYLFKDYVDSRIISSRDFVFAVYETMRSGLVQKEYLVRKLKMVGKKVYRSGLVSEYLRQIEDILNFHSKEKIRLS